MSLTIFCTKFLFPLFVISNSMALIACGAPDCNHQLSSDKFLYFAYGSNMMTKRIQLKNQSAARVGIGRLENHRIDFVSHSNVWQGAFATVVPTDDCCVYGAIWSIDNTDMKHLDEQEGVAEGIYKALKMNVLQEDGNILQCRVYVHSEIPQYFEQVELIPECNRPSRTYLDVIKEGAKESNLPFEYVEYLFKIPDNGKTSSVMNILTEHIKD